jgi:hypothetical protein
MSGFTPLPAGSMAWTRNVLGAEVTRLYTSGAVLTVVRGKAGDLVPAHGYTRGSVMFVASGRVEADGQVLAAGDGGSYVPTGGGYFAVRFLEDSVYVVARTADDQLTVPDIGERATAHLDA